MKRIDGRLSLEKLPLEVLLEILVYLSPRDLFSLRLTSHSLHLPASSNLLWRQHLLGLLNVHGALLDILSIPQKLWAFSLLHNGWFRAYSILHRVARGEWLFSDKDIIGSTWMVFFKSHLKEHGRPTSKDGSVISVEEAKRWHALIEFSEDGTFKAVDGLPLREGSWSVDKGMLHVTPYPPSFPSRDPKTWCRVLQTFSVLLIMDAPEFLGSLVDLNSEVLREAVRKRIISREEKETRERALEEARRRKLMDEKDDDLARRLRGLWSFRREEREEEESETEESEEEGDAESADSGGLLHSSASMAKICRSPYAYWNMENIKLVGISNANLYLAFLQDSDWSEDENETEDSSDCSICP
ncbi:hypothetical protein RUND412_003655 [Rhizina undulata]